MLIDVSCAALSFLALMLLGACFRESSSSQELVGGKQDEVSRRSPALLPVCRNSAAHERTVLSARGPVVEFEMCPHQNVIAVGEGIVTHVSEGVGPDDSGVLIVSHFVGKASGRVAVRDFVYTNIARITVVRGDVVMRGTPLGVPWAPKNPARWRLHISLRALDRAPMDLRGCHTQQGDLQSFVFPVDC